MFLPARMMRLTVIALQRDKRPLLTGLGELGVAQLTSTAMPATAMAKPRNVGEHFAQCASMLGRIAELHRALAIVLPTAPTLEVAGNSLERDQQVLDALEQRARQLLDARKSVQERLHQLESETDRFSAFSEVPLDRLQKSPFLHFVTGSFPDLRSIKKGLTGPVVLLQISKDKVIAIGTREDHSEWEQRLKQLGFHSEEAIPTLPQSLEALVTTSRQHVNQLSEELARLDADLGILRSEVSQTVPQIEVRTRLEKLLLSAEQTLGCTDSTVILTGWIPSDAADLLERRIREITNGVAFIDKVDPIGVAEEEIPVLLQPSRLLRPFQRLVVTFGLPSYHELEPTVFMAVTYFVMFGMMFGDVGQGLVLALVGGTVLAKGKKSGTRDGGALLIWAGLASMLFGALYGSYFGIPQLKQYALWHDPLEGSPTRLLLGAVAFGAVTISLGLILNIVNRIRHRDVSGGILGHFGLLGIGFYWGALAMIAKAAVGQAGSAIGIVTLLLLALPIIGWIVKELIDAGSSCERESRNWLLAIPAALVGAFESVLIYFANTVSFVRLAAYAMSHAALLVATFAVAAEVNRLSHVGSTLSIGIIIVGNLVAIGLEGIIAAVQGLRLEFYEFFSKFFSAEGKPFKPFQLTESADSAP